MIIRRHLLTAPSLAAQLGLCIFQSIAGMPHPLVVGLVDGAENGAPCGAPLVEF
jgi:hypothetical protein